MLALLPLVYGLTATLNHLGSGERLIGTAAITKVLSVEMGSFTVIEEAMSIMDQAVSTTTVRTAPRYSNQQEKQIMQGTDLTSNVLTELIH